ncbi:transporter substrate-binding domain-containing protein [Paenarthrobacter ilicis]|uniref:substrate-binding periplasmic protein n=1 Tax=Paenarthrobacter ilicis TaxID=43665 RepID=UPI0028CFFEE1|nr:transporter substrate-binding domain-containing protein [Paenarthrobacter ilicis]
MVTKKSQSASTSRKIYVVVGIILLSLLGGFIGAKFAPGGSGTSAASSTSASGPTWINEIKQRGELRVGCADAPPTVVVQSDGTCTGPDLLPLQKVAEALGVKFVTVATTWQNIIAGLQANQYDIVADLDQTVERTLSIQYTKPSWSYPGVFLVKRDSGITTVDQILKSDTPAAVSQGTATDRALSPLLKTAPLRVDNFQNAASAVTAKRATALFTDLGVAVENAKADSTWGIIVPTPRILENYVGYGVPQHADAQSLQVLNVAIDQAVVSGEIERKFAEVGYLDVDNLGDLQIR